MKPMPSWTVRFHWLPYWLGDSPAACVKCGKEPAGRDGGKFIDLNCQAAADGDVCLHWGNARKNGYHYIVHPVTRRRRKMTKAELDRPIFLWKTAQIKRWRRTAKKGTSYESRVRPMEVGEMAVICKRNGVIPCFELKSNQYSRGHIADRIVRRVKSTGAEAYYMALAVMPRCKQKGAAVLAAGAQFAVLAHSTARPGDLSSWRYTRIWGTWA